MTAPENEQAASDPGKQAADPYETLEEERQAWADQLAADGNAALKAEHDQALAVAAADAAPAKAKPAAVPSAQAGAADAAVPDASAPAVAGQEG